MEGIHYFCFIITLQRKCDAEEERNKQMAREVERKEEGKKGKGAVEEGEQEERGTGEG